VGSAVGGMRLLATRGVGPGPTSLAVKHMRLWLSARIHRAAGREYMCVDANGINYLSWRKLPVSSCSLAGLRLPWLTPIAMLETCRPVHPRCP
jgi:hypothetical protein